MLKVVNSWTCMVVYLQGSIWRTRTREWSMYDHGGRPRASKTPQSCEAFQVFPWSPTLFHTPLFCTVNQHRYGFNEDLGSSRRLACHYLMSYSCYISGIIYEKVRPQRLRYISFSSLKCPRQQRFIFLETWSFKMMFLDQNCCLKLKSKTFLDSYPASLHHVFFLRLN